MADLSLVKFYFAGELKSINIKDAKMKVTENGGIVRDQVDNDLWYLVTNNPNSKSEDIKRAKNLGVLFIDEREFLEMIK